MAPDSIKYFTLLFLLSLPTAGLASDWQYSGHIKYQAALNIYDATSLIGSGGIVTALDQDANLRLRAEKRDGSWDYKVHYEVGVLYGNTLEALRSLTLPFGSFGPTNDDKRLFNLTTTIYDAGPAAVVHRFDRASARFTSENFVFRVGRDAVSWGNGLVFQPMDIFNPFSPTAVDKEYKSGDDMLYAQWLFAKGDDLQLITIPRRNTSGMVDVAESSFAIKYRSRAGDRDTDILLARHYGENLVGVGTASDWGNAVVRGEFIASTSSTATVISGVANINYSWTWRKRNVSGFAEYFRNGFGIADTDYSTVATNTALISRINRGELFNVGRDYMVGGVTIGLTPRWQISPTLIWNLNDGSALWQIGASFDWKQNATILLGGIVPIGPQGTEFGGIPIGGQFFRPPTSIYGRVSHYF